MCSITDAPPGDPVDAGIAAIPTDRLEEEISELAAHIYAATCRWLLLVGEFERREGQLASGFQCCATWLAWRCSVAPDTAREHLRVARALPELDLVRREFGAGRLSYSKVRAITRVATRENEEYLTEMARHATAAQIERLCRSYRRVLATCSEAANESHARRELSCSWDDDGSLLVRGRLPAEDGALFLKALEAGREALNRDARGEGGGGQDCSGTPNGYSELSAEGSVVSDQPDERPARDADALVFLAESALSGETRPLAGPNRGEIVVHVDANVLVDDASEGRCEIEDGPALAGETARRLACDGSLVRIIERDGRPLSVGRRTRTVSPALRRALSVRDKGRCRFPGCSRKHVDAHHIEHWARGGETKLSNLVQLCRRHHRLVHEGGYGAEPDGTGVRFTRPDGRVIPAAPRQRAGTHSRVRSLNERRGLRVDDRSAFPLSGGEVMNYAMTVDGLLQADSLTEHPPRHPERAARIARGQGLASGEPPP